MVVQPNEIVIAQQGIGDNFQGLIADNDTIVSYL